MEIIITDDPWNVLAKMTSKSVASEMIAHAKDYLLRAKEACGGSERFVEIAAKREVWKEQNQVDLSSEDQNYDQLAFLAAALELDILDIALEDMQNS